MPSQVRGIGETGETDNQKEGIKSKIGDLLDDLLERIYKAGQKDQQEEDLAKLKEATLDAYDTEYEEGYSAGLKGGGS